MFIHNNPTSDLSLMCIITYSHVYLTCKLSTNGCNQQTVTAWFSLANGNVLNKAHFFSNEVFKNEFFQLRKMIGNPMAWLYFCYKTNRSYRKNFVMSSHPFIVKTACLLHVPVFDFVT